MHNFKLYTLDEVQDKLIGKKGTLERDNFEYELSAKAIVKSFKKDTFAEIVKIISLISKG